MADVKDFLIWAYSGEFKKAEITIKKSQEEKNKVSLYVPKGIEIEMLALIINYTVQKGITKGIFYCSEASICSLDDDTQDIKEYISNNKNNEL